MIKITITGLQTGEKTTRTFTIREEYQRRTWVETMKNLLLVKNNAINISSVQV